MSARTPPANIDQYRRRKRQAGNFRWVLITLLFSACAVWGYFFSMSPFFGVEQVLISGNEQVSAESLFAFSGISMGQNIFTVDTARVQRWLCMDPFIKTAQVAYVLPRTVKITVTERRPVAVLATGQAFVQVDDNGLVLLRLRELDTLDLPILSGISGIAPGAVPGSRIECRDMQVALTVLNTLPKQAFPAVKEIDVTDNQKIRLYIEGGIEVRLGGSGDMAEKYLLANGIIDNAKLSGRASQIGYIDVSSTEKPVIYYLEH